MGLRRETKRTETEAQPLTAWRGQQAEVAEALDLAQECRRLVRQRQPERLDPWRQRATTRAVDAIRRFATGLYADYEAVKAGGTLPWHAGPVEGPSNRRKMLKRQMFGRARLALRRCLRAPRPGRQCALRSQERSDAPPSSGGLVAVADCAVGGGAHRKGP